MRIGGFANGVETEEGDGKMEMVEITYPGWGRAVWAGRCICVAEGGVSDYRQV